MSGFGPFTVSDKGIETVEKAITQRGLKWLIRLAALALVITLASVIIERSLAISDILHVSTLGERFSGTPNWGLILQAATVGFTLMVEWAISGLITGSILIAILYFAFGENVQRGLDSDIDVLIVSLQKAAAEGVDVAAVLERARRLRVERKRSIARRVMRMIILALKRDATNKKAK